jgi:para-aminobenzoate synthetase component I
MVRSFRTFPASDGQHIKQQMLNWLSRFNIFCFLDDHQYALPGHALECIAGVDAAVVMPVESSYITSIHQFTTAHKDWIFGHLGYALKAETEQVSGGADDPVGFEPAFLFVPRWVIRIGSDALHIGSLENDHDAVWDAILSAGSYHTDEEAVHLTPSLTKEAYIHKVRQLQEHILRGNCYEVNFCQAFSDASAMIDPLRVFRNLARVSPNPFAAFYRVKEKFLMCASPERFIQLRGNNIISQPIKGTIARDLNDAAADEDQQRQLLASRKEKAENVMVVDLVRNDLSRICKEGTVRVSELFGIYPFPQVHQMISTIEGELKAGVAFADIVKACFPMGSMTGAPKKKVLELIDLYETVGRGLFSGSVGYISPEGNFDFNVVIRSLLYNQHKQYLTYLVGSGITFYADAEHEYAECMVKAEAMEKAVQN